MHITWCAVMSWLKSYLVQGYWPDGIYTAATEEALLYDMRMAHALGFTTLRKHIKVEPDRYYYHADLLGMLIWQDMPSMYWVSLPLLARLSVH